MDEGQEQSKQVRTDDACQLCHQRPQVGRRQLDRPRGFHPIHIREWLLVKEHEKKLRDYILMQRREIGALRMENANLRAKEEIYSSFQMEID